MKRITIDSSALDGIRGTVSGSPMSTVRLIQFFATLKQQLKALGYSGADLAFSLELEGPDDALDLIKRAFAQLLGVDEIKVTLEAEVEPE